MELAKELLLIVAAPIGTETHAFNALKDGTSILKESANQ
jgi:hypothetical protein